MEGLDDIGLTMEKADAIDAFEQAARRAPLGLMLVQDWRSSLCLEEKAQHLARRIGTAWIGVGTVRAAAGPGMAASVQQPVLHHRRPALVANDRAGVCPPVGRACFRALDALAGFGLADDSRGIRRHARSCPRRHGTRWSACAETHPPRRAASASGARVDRRCRASPQRPKASTRSAGRASPPSLPGSRMKSWRVTAWTRTACS